MMARFSIILCLWSISAMAQNVLGLSLVVTQVPDPMPVSSTILGPAVGVQLNRFPKARLVLVSPEGKNKVLSEGFDSACDPSLSFDAKRLLFAGQKEPRSHWRIWEIGIDGSGLRAISPEQQEAWSPIYATTLFTLDSPEPWFTLIYVARENTVNQVGHPFSSSLYNLKLDGTELRRLTYNPNLNLDPFQMWDGRVVYAAEAYPHEPGRDAGRIGLFAIHVEGADMESYGGELGGPIQRMPCATEGGLVVFVESAPGAGDGAGQLGCVEERRPHVTYRKLTDDAQYIYLHPSPLDGHRVLVARRPVQGETTWGVYAFDVDQHQIEPLFDTPEFHEVQALAVKPRSQPDGHSTVVNPKFNTGTFYGLNCLDAEPRLAPHLHHGMVKRVRFIEGLPQTEPPTSSSTVPVGPFVPCRLVGEAPVESDGSFNVEVPADIPLLLQTLDERGLALASCGWIWVKPKESRGCIGCHEDPERTPENEYVLALRRPSNRLTLPPEQRRRISFRNDIAPLLQKHCASAECHGGNNTPLGLPLTAREATEQDLQKAYQALMVPARNESRTPAPRPQPGKYVDAHRARTSWLVWQILGVKTSRPWDRNASPALGPERKVTPMPPSSNHRLLNEVELRTIIQWIDLGAPYAANPVTEPPTSLTKDPAQ